MFPYRQLRVNNLFKVVVARVRFDCMAKTSPHRLILHFTSIAQHTENEMLAKAAYRAEKRPVPMFHIINGKNDFSKYVAL